MKNINIKVEDELHQNLKGLAGLLGINLKDLIKNALKECLEGNKLAGSKK